ncbi:MAG: sugar O-acetyltransferase [Lachnospiraceae bacterium]|nr:sugar O-acetyltransferase [Lachnospiraceae bacterium]
MTEKEKALAGLEFMRGGMELKIQRDHAEALCFELNNTYPKDTEKREEILRKLIKDAKEGCYIKSPFICEYGEYISLGRNFFANYNCKLMDGGKITFGDDVMVGPDCTFVTAEHPIDPVRRHDGYMRFKPITVGNNVWFGAGVLVCPGVTIGDNCVIGAGSVVINDIPANSVAVGNPCRVVRNVSEYGSDCLML